MLPNFDADGNLPPGIHPATWAEIEDRFGTTEHRRRLLSGLRQAALALKAAGCSMLYLDGSFVTSKDTPNDFDGCWEVSGVKGTLLDPVLLNFDAGRLAQKLKYRGELFPASAQAEVDAPWRTFLEFFQQDKDTGNPKGIVAFDLRTFS